MPASVQCVEIPIDTNILSPDMLFNIGFINLREFPDEPAAANVKQPTDRFISIPRVEVGETACTTPTSGFDSAIGQEYSIKSPSTISAPGIEHSSPVSSGPDLASHDLRYCRTLRGDDFHTISTAYGDVDVPEPVLPSPLIAPAASEWFGNIPSPDHNPVAAVRNGSGGVEPNARILTLGAGAPNIIEHLRRMEIPYGTLAAWINPTSIRDRQTLASQDEHEPGDCGRFELGMDCGRIFLGLGNPNCFDRCDWMAEKAVLAAGRWTHIAMTFDNLGTKVFVNGFAVQDWSWRRLKGSLDCPSSMVDFSLENNRHPIVLGCANRRSGRDGTDNEVGVSRSTGPSAFIGRIGAFALWGGYSPGDALNAAQIRTLARRLPTEQVVREINDPALFRPVQNMTRRRGQRPRSSNRLQDRLCNGAGHQDERAAN